MNVADRGLLLGDGLFETLAVFHGEPIKLKAHWERLQEGLAYLRLPLPHTLRDIKDIITTIVAASPALQERASIRITVTRGSGSRGLAFPDHSQPTLLITAAPLANNLTTHTRVTTQTDQRINALSPLIAFKTLNYLENVLAREAALAKGFDDAILLNTQEQLVSATAANLFIVQNNILYTPSLSCGALPGITRACVLNLAAELSITTQEANLTLSDLSEASEAFITNSLIGIRPIQQINSTTLNISTNTITPILQQKLAEYAPIYKATASP